MMMSGRSGLDVFLELDEALGKMVVVVIGVALGV